MARTRRTKAQYARLFDDPSALFGPGTKVTLYPNGEPEIWIQSADGCKGYRIRCGGGGPAGFGVTVGGFALGPVTSFSGNTPDNQPTNGDVDNFGLELCQYNRDERSQAYKRWYKGEGGYPCETCGSTNNGSMPTCPEHRKESSIA